MRVDERNPASVGTAQSGKAEQPKDIGRPPEARAPEALWPETGDQVELSDLAGRISRVLSAWEGERAERIGRLAQAYAEGRYQADARALSRILVAEAEAAARERLPGTKAGPAR